MTTKKENRVLQLCRQTGMRESKKYDEVFSNAPNDYLQVVRDLLVEHSNYDAHIVAGLLYCLWFLRKFDSPKKFADALLPFSSSPNLAIRSDVVRLIATMYLTKEATQLDQLVQDSLRNAIDNALSLGISEDANFMLEKINYPLDPNS